MTAQPVEVAEVRAGDTLTITGTVVKVRGGGRLALVHVTGGDFYVPLPGPNALPEDEIRVDRPLVVVVEQAPAPQQVIQIRSGGCSSCGR